MIEIGKYLIVEREEDLKENVDWTKEEEVRIFGIGVIHHKGKKDFPQYYEYIIPHDPRSCGDYWFCEKEEIIKEVDNRIKKYEKIKKILDN